eukprot:8924036-Pyramimonas_sp.AAC.1
MGWGTHVDTAAKAVGVVPQGQATNRARGVPKWVGGDAYDHSHWKRLRERSWERLESAWERLGAPGVGA